jgi:LysM repeat protein
MLDGGELDVKATLQFKVLVFAVQQCNLITDIEVEALDLNKLSELPGMVIYIAGKNDTLWDIGKRYYVPIAQLKEVNELASEEIRAGDKILVVKGGI